MLKTNNTKTHFKMKMNIDKSIHLFQSNVMLHVTYNRQSLLPIGLAFMSSWLMHCKITFWSKCFFTLLTWIHKMIWEMLWFNMVSHMSSSIVWKHITHWTLEAFFTLPKIFRDKLKQVTWVTDFLMSWGIKDQLDLLI